MSIDYSKIKLPPHIRMDCYRMALYPVLKYYNADADLLMISDDIQLSYKEKLICKETSCFSIFELLLDSNIEYFFPTLSSKDEFLSVIKEAIYRGEFVICFLDVYYYSVFPSVYQKVHTTHGIPLYGYNDKKKVFYTIDSDYLESFNRVFLEVPFEDVINSVIGYSTLKKSPNIQLLKRNDNESIKPISVDDIRKKYIARYSEKICSNICDNHMNEMDDFYSYIAEFSSSEKDMIKFSKQSYKYIDQFINARMLEYYGMSFIFKNIDYLRQLNMLTIEKSNFIRSIMYRTVYTGEYRRQSFKKFPEYFKAILNNERKRLEFMTSFKWEDNIQAFNI